MTTLYEMAPEVKFLCEMLESEQIDEQIFEDSLKGLEVDKKIEGCVYVQKQLESDLEAFKREKDRLEEHMKTMKNNLERVKNNLLEFVNYTGVKRMNVGTFKLRVGKSIKAVVLDEEKVPKEFLLPQKPKINVKDLREHLKGGEKVEGATLVESEYITIR